VILLFAYPDGVIGYLQQVDPLRASPAAVGRHQGLALGVDDPAGQRIGAGKKLADGIIGARK
jgi:hypothetical protein